MHFVIEVKSYLMVTVLNLEMGDLLEVGVIQIFVFL